MICPNKRAKAWIDLVEEVGENLAYFHFYISGGEYSIDNVRGSVEEKANVVRKDNDEIYPTIDYSEDYITFNKEIKVRYDGFVLDESENKQLLMTINNFFNQFDTTLKGNSVKFLAESGLLLQQESIKEFEYNKCK